MKSPKSSETLDAPPRRKVVILGGGTAGWMTAAALIRYLGARVDVVLVESEEIGIVGVGEATLPHLRHFIEQLGIDEADFMQATNATFKLGIDFQNFGRIGDRYIHPFGTYGREVGGVPFHHFWLRQHGNDATANHAAIEPYSIAIQAARAGRFARPDANASNGLGYGYAYQFDATRFGPYLRTYATARGVDRIEGKVQTVDRGTDGDITGLCMSDGRKIMGDLFVDCSGFGSLLLGKTIDEPWEDWSRWLPCDRAAALPCTSPPGEIEPYTRAVAMPGGWRWRIPLQHRVGNGYVFSSAHVSDDEACAAILDSIEGRPLADPRILRFRAGRRRRSWVRNVVAIGLASGFLEPLESTSIYLVQMAITQLVELFPLDVICDDDRIAFNTAVDMEYDRIRDFLILHYKATTRNDSSFWDHVRTMDVPDTLATKLDLWQSGARIAQYQHGLFLEPSWVAVCLGQGIVPASYDPRADQLSGGSLTAAFSALRAEISAAVSLMPGHGQALQSLNRATAVAA